MRTLAAIAGNAARLGAHVGWEKLTRPRPSRLSAIPPTGDAITPAWLTAALCAGHPGARVTSVETESVDSGTTSRARLRLGYDEAGRRAGLPETVFIKTSEKFRTRFIMGTTGLLANEARFFREVRPHIDIESPIAYYAACDERSCRSIILMNDLAEKEPTFCTASRPLTRSQMEALIASLARLHGLFWDSPRLVDEFASTRAGTQGERIRKYFVRRGVPRGIERAGDAVPEILRSSLDRIWRCNQRLGELNERRPHVLLHGDPHVRNTYLTASGAGGLCDWQCFGSGQWARDYAYLLITSLAIEDRRRWERELLAFYLDRVAQAGGKPPDFDKAWHFYRQQPLRTWVAWVYSLGFSAFEPDWQPHDESRLIIERASTAILDHDTLNLLDG